MKELKDYLHLYLGCDLKCPLSESPTTNGVVKLTPEFLQAMYDYPDDAERCKPILRPLSDMTEEEMKGVALLNYNIEKTIKEVSFYNNGIDIITAGFLGEFRIGLNSCNAETFQYLLSKHFDLFGLIESGLAIDKKLNSEQNPERSVASKADSSTGADPKI